MKCGSGNTAPCRKKDIVRHVENGSTKPYFGDHVFNGVVDLHPTPQLIACSFLPIWYTVFA